jgi:hypothetical protein
MTQFIESFSTHQLLPPYHSEESEVQGFLFKIGVEAIQTFCDTFLNLGDQSQRPFLYKPIADAPFGMLTITRYPKLCSLDRRTPESLGVKGAAEWDHLEQTEFFAAVPVHRYSVTAANLLVDPVVQWVQPFIIVDNATSAFSGREILGLDTLYGDISNPREPKIAGGDTFKISLPSWKRFAPNSAQEMLSFATIDRGPPLTDAEYQAAVGQGLADVITELENAIPDLAGIAEGKFPETLELVILKQFRSAANATQAIYQALITCENRYSNVTDMRIFDAKSVKIEFLDGDMVDEILSAFLNLPRKHLDVPMIEDPDGSKRPLVTSWSRQVPVVMAFSFTATIDLMTMKSQFNFRRPAAA